MNKQTPFLRGIHLAFFLLATGCWQGPGASTSPDGIILNDVHSRLNATSHISVVTPRTVEEIQSVVRDANTNGQFISISGGRHSMGGQQFGTKTINLSLATFNKVIGLDTKR